VPHVRLSVRGPKKMGEAQRSRSPYLRFPSNYFGDSKVLKGTGFSTAPLPAGSGSRQNLRNIHPLRRIFAGIASRAVVVALAPVAGTLQSFE
jgi:hypothetical protein